MDSIMINECTYPFYITFSIQICGSVLELNSGHEYRNLLSDWHANWTDRPIWKM